MKKVGLLVCALFLLTNEARAQPVEARGCVTLHGTCTVLHATDGRTYTLSGRKLPPPNNRAVVLVRGKRTSSDPTGACALRFIFESGIAVKSWGFTRALCQR